MEIIKKLSNWKILQVILSGILIYWAFRKVDVWRLLVEISQVKWWWVTILIGYMAISVLIGGWRWAILNLGKPKFKQILDFTKAAYSGAFFALFFPTALGGDLVKWTTLIKKYPDISKMKLASSTLIDRIIGFGAFLTTATISLLIGKVLKYNFPNYLMWIFIGLSVLMMVFYVIVFRVDFEKLFLKRKSWARVIEVMDILKKSHKDRIWKCYIISLGAQLFWLFQVWMISRALGIGMNYMDILIFLPVISLILTLPISWAGFGMRENLFVYFFVSVGYQPEQMLLVSTFLGTLGVLNALIGGLWLLF